MATAQTTAQALKPNQPAQSPKPAAPAQADNKNAIPENESKEDRFKRVALPRVLLASKYLRLLKQTSHTGNYKYNEEQVKKIKEKLQSELDEAIETFEAGLKGKGTEETKESFSL